MLYLLFVLGTLVPLSTQHDVASETILQNKITSTVIHREYNASTQHNASIDNGWFKCRSHSDCLHGGSCEFGANNVLACRCQLGWTGTDCGTITCETEGSCVRGTCEHGRHCVCDEGWHGFFCNERITSLECNEELGCENGDCINGICICQPGFYGATCNAFNCSRGECGPHGKCSANASSCDCQEEWSGMLCDQYSPTEHSNWITFQRRMVFDIDFDRTFSEYERGFGNADSNGDFWLGLDKLHDYTKEGDWLLRIDIVRYDGTRSYNEYTGFKILVPPFYVITWESRHRGDLEEATGNGLDYHKGAAFSATDRDNDGWSEDCSNNYGGGWWFDHCQNVLLNAEKQPSSSSVSAFYMRWWTGYDEIPIVGSTMRMRKMD